MCREPVISLRKLLSLLLSHFSQFILSYALAFILGTIVHGLGTAPHNFAAHFAVTVLIQLLCSIAWASIATFALYMTHSIVAIFVSFILRTAVLGLPTVFFPKIELFKYFGLNFNFVLASDATVALKRRTKNGRSKVSAC